MNHLCTTLHGHHHHQMHDEYDMFGYTLDVSLTVRFPFSLEKYDFKMSSSPKSPMDKDIYSDLLPNLLS